MLGEVAEGHCLEKGIELSFTFCLILLTLLAMFLGCLPRSESFAPLKTVSRFFSESFLMVMIVGLQVSGVAATVTNMFCERKPLKIILVKFIIQKIKALLLSG